MAEAHPKVSIIIPVYNGASTLDATLKGVSALSYPKERFEVIVVDNNSTDASADIAMRYPIKLVHAERRNRAFARNTGARAATGDLLFFLDCDCVPEPLWIGTLVSLFTEPDVGAVQGQIIPKGSSAVSYRDFEHTHLGLPFIDTKGCAIRLRAWKELGGFDDSLSRCEDIDLGWRIAQSAWLIRFSDETSVTCGLPRSFLSTVWRAFESSKGLREVHKKWSENAKLTPKKILSGFLRVGRRNVERRGRVEGISLAHKALYAADDIFTGVFYIIRWTIGL